MGAILGEMEASLAGDGEDVAAIVKDDDDELAWFGSGVGMPPVMGSSLTTETSSVTAWTARVTSDGDGTHRVRGGLSLSLIRGASIIGLGFGRRCTERQPWLPTQMKMVEHR
ncbi:hypothetical protein ACLOJK_040749 [Asimina triloba]